MDVSQAIGLSLS
jgi:hypothetical protein